MEDYGVLTHVVVLDMRISHPLHQICGPVSISSYDFVKSLPAHASDRHRTKDEAVLHAMSNMNPSCIRLVNNRWAADGIFVMHVAPSRLLLQGSFPHTKLNHCTRLSNVHCLVSNFSSRFSVFGRLSVLLLRLALFADFVVLIF